MGQNCGSPLPAKDCTNQPERGARPVPQLCPKRASTTHHYPPSEPAREPGQPRTEAGRRAGPASYYYYSCWPIWRTFFFCATNRRNPSASEVCMYVINGIVSLRICVYVLHIHTHIYIYILYVYTHIIHTYISSRRPWWRALSQITLPCALKRHATVLRESTTMCCVDVRHKWHGISTHLCLCLS